MPHFVDSILLRSLLNSTFDIIPVFFFFFNIVAFWLKFFFFFSSKHCNGSRIAIVSLPILIVIITTATRFFIIHEDHFQKSIMEEETNSGFTSPLYRSPPYFCGLLVFLFQHHDIIIANKAADAKANAEADAEAESGSGGTSSLLYTPAAARAAAAAARTRRRTTSQQSIGQAALTRVTGLCLQLCIQIVMIVCLLTLCVVGVGTHRTFGVRRQAWLEWTHANSKSGRGEGMHVAHAVLGRPVFGVLIAFWLSVVTREKGLCGVQSLMSWWGWAPLARLSYGAYLFTYVAIWCVVPHFIVKNSMKPTGWRVRAIFVSSYVSVLVLLLMLASLLYCVIERPFVVGCGRRRRLGTGGGEVMEEEVEVEEERRSESWDVLARKDDE